MITFWKSGYETTSISELLAVMNISAPSLYTAFGDKQRLFIEAVDLYVSIYGDPIHAALSDAPTARDGVELLLAFAITEHLRPTTPKGCMLVTAAASGSGSSLDVQEHLAALRSDQRNLIKARIERGINEGDVPHGADASALSYFYSTILQGMSIQARGGVKRQALENVAALAMNSWPASESSREKAQ